VAFPDMRCVFVLYQGAGRKQRLILKANHPTLRCMSIDDRKSGVALIAGTLGTIITMALHPTARDLMAPEHSAVMTQLNIAVHSLALVSMPITFLGALGLARRLDAPNRLAVSALVFFSFSEIAAMIAAAASGLIAPRIIHQIATAAPGQDQVWRAVLTLDGLMNQAFALILVVAGSVAMVCWSAAMLKSERLETRLAAALRFPRWLGNYGCIVGPLTVLAVLSGHIRLNVHGFGMVVVLQAVWFIGVGAGLWRIGAATRSHSGIDSNRP
jgi:hypothetical protein